MPKVKFLKENQELEVHEGANLRKEAMRAGIQLYPGIHRFLNCRGLALCAKCAVLPCGTPITNTYVYDNANRLTFVNGTA